MYVPDSPPRYCAYLLRCWTEHSSRPEHSVVWRFSLENPHTGTRHGFASFEALTAFLAMQLSDEPSSPHTTPMDEHEG
jgi:hypothetical protein